MRIAIPLSCLLFAGVAPAQAETREVAPDAWFGRDKALHFGASAALATGGYALTSVFSESRTARLIGGAGLALTAGAGKELYDLLGPGDPSWRDLVWDVIGTSAGLLLAYTVDRFVVSPWLQVREASSGAQPLIGLSARF